MATGTGEQPLQKGTKPHVLFIILFLQCKANSAADVAGCINNVCHKANGTCTRQRKKRCKLSE